jgi:hypothetical protein
MQLLPGAVCPGARALLQSSAEVKSGGANTPLLRLFTAYCLTDEALFQASSAPEFHGTRRGCGKVVLGSLSSCRDGRGGR